MVKKIFFLLIVVLIGYTIFLIARPHYNYYAFKSELREVMKINVTWVEKEVIGEIMKLVEKYNIPVEERDIKLYLKEERFVAETSWDVTVNFLGIYKKTYEFSVDSSQ